MINKKKILIADHDVVNLDFFDLMLSKLGFTVEKARDGQNALEKITGADYAGAPDLIITNTVLPKVSGWEILKTVKQNRQTALIPVLLISEIDDVKEIVEAFELGADDYIVKPFNFSVVLARIRAALRGSEIFAQLRMREKRIALAEQLNDSLKQMVTGFQQATESLVAEITGGHDEKEEAAFSASKSVFMERLKYKAAPLQDMLAKMEKCIEQTQAEREIIKKQEIGLTVLEKNMYGMVD
jgi:DNA-binding response OmpR family regulator